MEIRVVSRPVLKLAREGLVVFHFEGSKKPEGEAVGMDKALGGTIAQMLKQGDLKGKLKEISLIYSMGKLAAPKVVVAGLGKKEELSPDKIRVIAAGLARFLRTNNIKSAVVAPFWQMVPGLKIADIGRALAEGALLGSYTFTSHKSKAPEEKPVRRLEIICEEKDSSELKSGVERGQILANSANLARDLVNEPSNVMTPTRLAQAALDVGQRRKLDVSVIEKSEMERLGMGGLLSVAQGSQQPPKFNVMKYKGRDSDKFELALVGKGITFDSGGISIKPSEGMGDMKGDMAGGASVIAVFDALSQLKPRTNVVGLIPATENLPSGTAYKPGDIIKIMNGKTVEIITTDAEGRLILADAISYGVKMGVKRIVDIATLTGACHIALGDVCTGVFGNNQEFTDRLVEAGKASGECMWPMPMNEEYREQNKSDIADIKNSGGRFGGASSAAWFLGEFVEKVPWIHLDIAGTSDISKERGYLVKGATGVPVRTLAMLATSLAEE